ncbi:MAG: FMN-binding protein [Planctomycetaceae bacterium]|nr:FMN-binding protein [Planctomycetaceae bacterium]
MKENYLKQSWLVIVLALVFGVALAFVQTSLASRIEQNKLDLTLKQIPALVPGAAGGRQETISGKTVFQALDKSGRQVGWVVKGSGLGFADVIELLVGLNNDTDRITGMYVLDQKETPGLGNKIGEEAFSGQFAGKSSARPLVVVKGSASAGNQVAAISGATISSQSVTDIVNKTVQDIRPLLAGKSKRD